jgi:outer membrane immunogenic protein
MKGLIGGAALAALLAAGPAAAADMLRSAAPVYNQYGFYNWNGFYIGLNAGAHWSGDTDTALITSNTFWSSNNVTIVNAALPVTYDRSGFAGGGQAGFNWQVLAFVFGVEADIMSLTGTTTRTQTVSLLGPKQQDTLIDSAGDRWMATVRGRVGYAFDRVLLYITGGGAASNWSIAHSYSDNVGAGTPLTTDQISQTHYGWTAGGGIEFAMLSNWTVRAEYLYANIGSISSALSFQNAPGRGATIAYAEGLTESVARAAVNYKFGR